jgi:YtoQ family protein
MTLFKVNQTNNVESEIMKYNVYLSGEIHSDWREEIIQGCQKHGLDISFSSAVTVHEESDSAGDVLGAEDNSFWRDHKSAKVNAIRTSTLIERCDIAIIRFGDKYKQWNAAFDAGYCAALSKPYITLHSDELIHPLKEVDAAAQAWATTVAQVVETLKYLSK